MIEDNLKDLLIGQDPFAIEKRWNDMFWRVRGYGRKGIAFPALSAVDLALRDRTAGHRCQVGTGCRRRESHGGRPITTQQVG